MSSMPEPMHFARPVSPPWLTVIMPAYQGEQWINFTLGSLAAEPTEGVEVPLIDGSPTPGTRDIANRYTDRLQLRTAEATTSQDGDVTVVTRTIHLPAPAAP